MVFWVLLASPAVQGQEQPKKNIWDVLSNLEWEERYSKVYRANIGFPKFSAEVKALEGKEVTIRGFIIPLDAEDGSVILSSMPYSSCFFCGGAGIETVIAVFPKKNKKFTVEAATFRGALELNDGETGLIYNLRNATEVLTAE